MDAELSRELTKFNVVSSRVRLARNIEGMSFPRAGRAEGRENLTVLYRGADAAARGLFDYNFFFMKDLAAVHKLAMVERHLISPALQLNDASGAVILEKSEHMSVMLNEEDRVRIQCVCDGFSLRTAYRRAARYDDRLSRELPIAYDEKLGYLTACPTNLGTGMRASAMLFLPALKLAGAIETALSRFVKDYGLTVRGVYGEGSSAEGDMYQLSNTRTLGVNEENILDAVERAACEMCAHERRALDKLASEKGAELYDKVCRSYGVLTNAYMLSSSELMKLISDVKLGVILGIVPVKDTKPLDKLLVLCSAANLSMAIGERRPEERDVARAELVRQILRR